MYLPGRPPEKAWQFGSPPATLYTMAVGPGLPVPRINIFIYGLLFLRCLQVLLEANSENLIGYLFSFYAAVVAQQLLKA